MVRAPSADAISLGPNGSLIGVAGSRNRLMTPCLVLDLPALDRNIARMAALCRDAGVALRPHAKTHKSVQIARRQIAAGAVGISAATLGEAEVLVGGGIGDVLITSVIVGEAKHERLMRLLKTGAGVTIVADDMNVAKSLAEAASRHGVRIPIYMDVDMGRHRSGVLELDAAVALAGFLHGHAASRSRACRAMPDILHRPTSARTEGVDAAGSRLQAIRSALTSRGIPVEQMSGASTGSALIDIERRTYTELQCGSYVCMDVEYDAVPLDRAATRLFEPALFVRHRDQQDRSRPGHHRCRSQAFRRHRGTAHRPRPCASPRMRSASEQRRARVHHAGDRG